jgi:hypothetical protein
MKSMKSKNLKCVVLLTTYYLLLTAPWFLVPVNAAPKIEWQSKDIVELQRPQGWRQLRGPYYQP